MPKNSGGTKSTSWRNKQNTIETLKDSNNWQISLGMNRYDKDKDNPVYDFSDMRNLSEEDKTYLVAYLSHSYGLVNEQLRNGEVSSEVKTMVKGIDKAIDKLDTYEGNVYRGIHFSTGRKLTDRRNYEEALNFYKQNVGNTVTEKSYISTGKTKSKIDRKFGSEDNSIKFTIESKKGRNLSRYNNEEDEILFKRGTKFRIVSVRGNSVHLKEV